MNQDELAQVLNRRSVDPVLVLGNGINRYGPSATSNSWHELLVTISKSLLPEIAGDIPKGVSTTEFYDILELRSKRNNDGRSLQKEFCRSIDTWQPFEHHRRIMRWAQRRSVPILTTNFDKVLSDAVEGSHWHLTTDGFTDYYPWSSYYADKPIGDPSSAFAIWHVNGMSMYPRSIRLGLSHYMGSAQRLRGWLHRGRSRLFRSEKAIVDWPGSQSWLDAFFRRDLVIIGLSLDEVEVFLRWALIERARLFTKFPRISRKAWYVQTAGERNHGKELFLKGVGVDMIEVPDYLDIYENPGWD